MNTIIRSCGLLMLGMTAACALEVGPPPGEAPSGREVPGVPTLAGSPAPKRDGAPFGRRIRAQLAARGIKVHGGPEPGPKPEPTPERTTVELPWIVPGSPMIEVTVDNPTTAPHRYATHLSARWPNIEDNNGVPRLDQDTRGSRVWNCSGTLIDSTAVLTAAHCVINWQRIGINATTRDPVFAKVRAYSLTGYPRRTGSYRAHGPLYVKKSFWDFSNWPSADEHDREFDLDYAVLRFKPSIALPTASQREVSTPQGMSLEMAHYPAPRQRGFEMFYSSGFVGNLSPGSSHSYKHAISSEPGSSGAGMFEVGVPGVVGILSAQDAAPSAYPNIVNMLTPSMLSDIAAWVFAPI